MIMRGISLILIATIVCGIATVNADDQSNANFLASLKNLYQLQSLFNAAQNRPVQTLSMRKTDQTQDNIEDGLTKMLASYAAAQNSYQPTQSYNAPQPTYSAPAVQQPSYSAPAVQQSSYGAPAVQAAPQPTYSAPAAPQPTYSAPAAPQPTYSAPAAPQPTYSAPAAPQPTYSAPAAPQPTYSAPQSNYGPAPAVQAQSSYGQQNVAAPIVAPTPCSPNPCKNEGVCTEDGAGGYKCACPWGWTGVNCEICITDCASNPCPSNKRCKARYGGGYDCICPADRVGANCEIQNDLCSSQPCAYGGVCAPAEGGTYECTCPKPYAGKNCEQVWTNPCTEEVLRKPEAAQFKNPWDRKSYLVCTDVNQYVSMNCPPGTYFNDVHGHCIQEGYNPPVCPSGYCQNGGECLIDDKNMLKCVCRKGFSGERCEVNIDECLISGNAACAGGTCVDQVNGFYCMCAYNTIGLNCQQTMANPCTSDNVANDRNFHEMPSPDGDLYMHCTGEGAFILNRCAEGLFWNQAEGTCTVERPLRTSGICSTFPCRNGGTCQSADGSSFTCMCREGYTGQTCEQMIDYCQSNPCQNGGRCLPYAGGYTCVCQDKIIDECCCNGVTNPCPPKASLIPGVNNYFPHLYPHRYIHCDFDGRAFVRTCAPGLRWNQAVLSCLNDGFVLGNAQETVSSGPGGYANSAPPQVSTPVVAPQSNYGTPAVQQPVAPQSNYGTPAVQSAPQSSYGTPAVQQPAAPQSNYGTPAVQQPAAPQSSYGTPAVQSAPQSNYGTPAVQSAPQSSYGTPAVQSAPQSSYGTPAVQQPVAPQSNYGTPAVQQPAAPQSSYGTPAVQSAPQSSYGAPAAPAVQQSSYGNQQQPQLDINSLAQSMNMSPAQIMQLIRSSNMKLPDSLMSQLSNGVEDQQTKDTSAPMPTMLRSRTNTAYRSKF